MAPVSSVRDLGIHLDADITMRTHVAKTVAGCFACSSSSDQKHSPVSLSVGASIPRLVGVVTVGLRGFATLAGLPRQLLDRLQLVLNAAAYG